MRTHPLALLLSLTISCLCFGASTATPAKSIRDVLGAESFRKAGLEKLSQEELNYLSIELFGAIKTHESEAKAPSQAVLQAQQEVIAQLPSGEKAFGDEEKLATEVIKIQRVPDRITSRIQGRFDGWSGKTVFTLENGQVWKQSESGSFEVSLDSPEVTIRKGMLGVFFLNVKGYGSTIKVKRIK